MLEEQLNLLCRRVQLAMLLEAAHLDTHGYSLFHTVTASIPYGYSLALPSGDSKGLQPGCHRVAA